MAILKRIVFFWVGRDISVPSFLVASIRRHMNPALEVVQISDKRTARVPGTTHHKALDLSPSTMVARLEAYSSLAVTEPTLYLDADMLVMRDFDLPELGENEIGLTRRKEQDDLFVHERTQLWRDFPEFRGKALSEVMPYIYSFIYVRSEILFVRQLITLRKSAKRLQEWFGDQVTLRKEVDRGKFRIRNFDADQYNRTISSHTEYHALGTSSDPPCIVHFKGPAGKELLFETAATLTSSGRTSGPF